MGIISLLFSCYNLIELVYSAYICDIMEEKKWFEELPESRPPADAMICRGLFYRIAEGDPVRSLDFFLKEK